MYVCICQAWVTAGYAVVFVCYYYSTTSAVYLVLQHSNLMQSVRPLGPLIVWRGMACVRVFNCVLLASFLFVL